MKGIPAYSLLVKVCSKGVFQFGVLMANLRPHGNLHKNIRLLLRDCMVVNNPLRRSYFSWGAMGGVPLDLYENP